MNSFNVCLIDALIGKKTPAQNVHVEYCCTLPRRHALFVEPLKRTGVQWFVRWQSAISHDPCFCSNQRALTTAYTIADICDSLVSQPIQCASNTKMVIVVIDSLSKMLLCRDVDEQTTRASIVAVGMHTIVQHVRSTGVLGGAIVNM